jgi:hypothetical protein
MAKHWTDFMTQIGETLGLLKTKLSRLTNQRNSAESELERAKSNLQAHLLSDSEDQKIMAALQAKIDSSFSLLGSLNAAIGTQAERIADAERQKADEQNQAARKAASEAIAADVAKIESQIAPWLASTRKLATDLDKYGSFRFEAGGIARYLANAANEIELALSVTIPDLRGGIVAVAEGREKPPTPPAEVVKFVAPKPPPTEILFFLRHAKYTDASGAVKCLGKMREHALPPPLAKKALSSGAAIPLTDPRVRTLKGNWGMIVPGPDQCEALDGTPSGNAAPVIHSAFEPLDRGPPIIGAMRQPQTGTAMRSLPPGKK